MLLDQNTKRFSERKSPKHSPPKSVVPSGEILYDNISNLPIFNWWAIHKSRDPRELAKDKNINDDKMFRYCWHVWDDINDQHIEEFGIDKDFIIQWDAIRDIALKNAVFQISQDPYHEMMRDVAQREFDADYKGEKPDNLKTVGIMSKHFGYRIDIKTTMTDEFYANLNLIKEQARNGRNKS